MKKSSALILDAIINLCLGILLLLFPRGVIAALGAPLTENAFYPSLLGAVLIGIALALLLEGTDRFPSIIGLGLGGAICINLCGGLALAGWLVLGQPRIPVRGFFLLWGVVVMVIGISLVELRLQAAGSQSPKR